MGRREERLAELRTERIADYDLHRDAGERELHKGHVGRRRSLSIAITCSCVCGFTPPASLLREREDERLGAAGRLLNRHEATVLNDAAQLVVDRQPRRDPAELEPA